MKTNANDSISAGRFPVTREIGNGFITTPEDTMGLTKREYFAALVLQGIFAADMFNNAQDKADYAVKCADKLIIALNNESLK